MIRATALVWSTTMKRAILDWSRRAICLSRFATLEVSTRRVMLVSFDDVWEGQQDEQDARLVSRCWEGRRDEHRSSRLTTLGESTRRARRSSHPQLIHRFIYCLLPRCLVSPSSLPPIYTWVPAGVGMYRGFSPHPICNPRFTGT